MDADPRFDTYGFVDLTLIGFEPVLFPDYEFVTRKKLFIFYWDVMDADLFIYDLSANWLKIVRFFLNLIQLIVLTRKALRISSTNVILAIMSLNHIIVIVYVVLQEYVDGVSASVEPRQDPFIKDVLINSFRVTIIGNIFRTVLAWLPINMVITRAIAVIKPNNPKFNSPKIGLLTSIFILLDSVLIESVAFFILTSDGLAPSREYYQISTKVSTMYDNFTLLIQIIVPAFSYPVLLLLLTFCSCIAKNTISSTSQRNDSTSSMIVIMLIFFMIVEIPRGVGGYMSIYYGNNRGFYYLGQTLVELFDSFNVLNASIYCLICFKMTPNYKNTFYNMFKCRKKTVRAAEPTPHS